MLISEKDIVKNLLQKASVKTKGDEQETLLDMDLAGMAYNIPTEDVGGNIWLEENSSDTGDGSTADELFKDIVAAIRLRQKDSTVLVDETALHPDLPAGMYFICTLSGRTSENDLTVPDNVSENDIITDGTVEWKVCRFRQITPSSAVGSIYLYSGQTVPTGYLKCDGSLVERETYFDLFNVIGESYGAGDGSTTFRLPDLNSNLKAESKTYYIVRAFDTVVKNSDIDVSDLIKEKADINLSNVTDDGVQKMGYKIGIPIGTVITFPLKSNIPNGFLACDGSTVSRTIYPYLFDIIGTNYGAGDGSTTFQLPSIASTSEVAYIIKACDGNNMSGNILETVNKLAEKIAAIPIELDENGDIMPLE